MKLGLAIAVFIIEANVAVKIGLIDIERKVGANILWRDARRTASQLIQNTLQGVTTPKDSNAVFLVNVRE